MDMDKRQAGVDLIFGRWRSQILYAGVNLGLIDALGGGARSAADLAGELSLDARRTYRLARALACLGVLEEDGERRFSLTPTGEFFRGDHPQTLRGMTLLEESPEHYAVWKHLSRIVRDGKGNGFSLEFGHNLFEHTAVDPAYRAVFNEAMSSYSGAESAMVLEALGSHDFSGASHVCDIGGGQGHLACSLLSRNPHLRGTVYDLPATIQDPENLWAKKMNLEDRCTYQGGDMFQEVPAADIYLMKHILHDWNDEECIQILGNAHRVAPAGARCFVAEFIVPGPETPHFAKLFDIHMMCALTGMERTEAEYASLYERAGWEPAGVWYHDAALLGVVEAVKA